jgi:hypothetical protein
VAFGGSFFLGARLIANGSSLATSVTNWDQRTKQVLTPSDGGIVTYTLQGVIYSTAVGSSGFFDVEKNGLTVPGGPHAIGVGVGEVLLFGLGITFLSSDVMSILISGGGAAGSGTMAAYFHD